MPQSEQFIVAQRPSGSVFMRCIGMQSMEPDVVLAIQSEGEQFILPVPRALPQPHRRSQLGYAPSGSTGGHRGDG